MTAPSYDTKDDLLSRRLNEIAERFPGVARTARLYAAILPLLGEAEPDAASLFLSPDVAREKLERGQYLLQDLDVELDMPAVADLLLRIAAAAEMAGENVAASKVRIWLDERQDDLGAVLQEVLEGQGRLPAREAERMGMDTELFRALAQNALKPHLRAWGRRVTPPSAGSSWKRGTCFVCGALPVFGELRETDRPCIYAAASAGPIGNTAGWPACIAGTMIIVPGNTFSMKGAMNWRMSKHAPGAGPTSRSFRPSPLPPSICSPWKTLPPCTSIPVRESRVIVAPAMRHRSS